MSLKKSVIAVSGISSLFISVFFLGKVTPDIFPNHTPFDAERWKAWEDSSERDEELRWRMSSGLLRDKMIIGMQRAEVVDLLGPPYSETDNEAHYELGSTGFGVQYGVLIIHFDHENHVAAAIRITH
jgi:hypothetical protein